MAKKINRKVVNDIAFTNPNSTGKKNLFAGTRKHNTEETGSYNVTFKTEVKK